MKKIFCIKLELLRLIYRKIRAISFKDKNEAPIGNELKNCNYLKAKTENSALNKSYFD